LAPRVPHVRKSFGIDGSSQFHANEIHILGNWNVADLQATTTALQELLYELFAGPSVNVLPILSLTLTSTLIPVPFLAWLAMVSTKFTRPFFLLLKDFVVRGTFVS